MMSDETEVVARFRCQQETIHSLGSQFAMMAEHGSGEWVRYSDYRALEHQLVADRPPSPLPNAEEVEVESERWNRDEHGYWRNSRGESASGEYHSRALDTIARLTREVANLKLEHGRLYDQLDDGMLRVIEQIDDSHAELRREMGEAQKDTARWRYLRAHCAPPGTPEYNEPWFAVAPPEQYAVRSGAELDAAIDSALAPVPGERGDTTQTTESNT
jgi:hypothetical protein